jgi:hypothetical protein
MFPYIMASIGALGFFISGFVVRQFNVFKFLPLTADAQALRKMVIIHLDEMVNKSEIMIRHDARVFRDMIHYDASTLRAKLAGK